MTKRNWRSHTCIFFIAVAVVLPVATVIETGSAFAESSSPGTTTITSTSVSSTSATINWLVSATSDPIAEFQVSSGPGNVLGYFYPPAETGTITGLTPSTTYNLTFTTIYLEPVPDGAFIDNNFTVSTLAPGTSPPTTTLPPKRSTITSIKSVTTTLTAATIRWVPASYPTRPTMFTIDIFLRGNLVRTRTLKASTRVTTIGHLRPRTTYAIILFTYLGSGGIKTTGRLYTK
jgi:hypothetical protein